MNSKTKKLPVYLATIALSVLMLGIEANHAHAFSITGDVVFDKKYKAFEEIPGFSDTAFALSAVTAPGIDGVNRHSGNNTSSGSRYTGATYF